MRPGIVLFKESPMHMRKIEEVVELCDMFIQIGSSGSVFPAADLVQRVDGLKINISLDSPDNSNHFDINIKGYACVEVHKLVDKIIKLI